MHTAATAKEKWKIKKIQGCNVAPIAPRALLYGF